MTKKEFKEICEVKVPEYRFFNHGKILTPIKLSFYDEPEEENCVCPDKYTDIYYRITLNGEYDQYEWDYEFKNEIKIIQNRLSAKLNISGINDIEVSLTKFEILNYPNIRQASATFRIIGIKYDDLSDDEM